MADDPAGHVVTRGDRKRGEFVERGVVGAIAAEGDTDQQTGGPEIGGRIQLSALSWWKFTARAGTTVEIACL